MTFIGTLCFVYDYKDGDVEIFRINSYQTNILHKKAIELGIINIDIDNKVIKEEIEKSLSEKYNKEMKVNSLKIVKERHYIINFS